MAENQKYNLKDELLEADKKLTGSLSLLGMSMLTQPAYINSMRSVMFTSHLKQFVNLENPDFPGFFTNGENTVGKYSSAHKEAKHKTTVFRKIIKYGDILDTPYVYTLFVFDEKKNEYDVITRKDAENLTENFGFSYNNEYIDSLNEGDVIPKGTTIYKSKSYDENMDYGYGLNIKTMYTSDPYTSEDACVVSESLAKRMTSIELNTVSIGLNQNEFLLKMYSKSNDEYKCFPDIGEYAYGEVAVKRTLFKDQLLTDFKDSSLNKIFDSDISYYKNGKVIDIDVYCNNPEIEENPFNSQILKYLRSQNEYYEQIKNTCEEIMESGYKYSKQINYLYKRASEFLDDDKKWTDKDSVFSNLRIDITVKNIIPIQVGQKLTGRYGNKSVVSVIRKDEDMPYYYDENGNKVIIDLLLNLLAIVNRTTAFPIYELSMNFICNKVRMHMSKMEDAKERENLLFSIIDDFNEFQAKEMKKVYNKLSDEEKLNYIQDCIDDRIYIHQNPLWETKPIFFRLMDIYNKYDFLQPYDIYVDKWGRQIKTLNKGYIGDMYIIKLKQTSRKGFIVRNTGSISNKSLPEKSYKNKSATELYSSKPIRFGEFETLNFTIAMMPEDIQLFHLLYRSSINGRRDLAKNLLLGNDKFKLSKSYTSRVAEIFGVLLKSLGLRIEFINKDEELREFNDEEIKYFEYDDKPYLCTEYQMMLIKRKHEIEKEILNKHGFIDADELEKLTMEEMRNRNFIIGPSKEDYDSIPAFAPDTTDNEE